MILFKKQLFDLEVKVQRRSLRYAKHHLMVMHPHTKHHWPISKDNICVARTRKYYLKTIIWPWLTLRSKVKVTWRSLRYATHRLMVMHPHTKYHWPISKDKMLWSGQENTIFFFFIWPWGQRSRYHEGYYGTQQTTLYTSTHNPNIIDLSRKTNMLWPRKENTI
jgi:hypothetical protein